MIKLTFNEVFTYDALYRAHLKGRLCKRDKKPLVRFEMNMISNIYELYRKLRTGTYKFGKYNSFVVYEPKRREIQTLHYSGRIVQRVLCDEVLMPYFPKRAILDNSVCQKGKGSSFALMRFEKMLREHVKKHGAKGYFLKCDILKYFPSIPHDRLRELFGHECRDERINALVYDVIDSFHTSAEYLKNSGIEPLGEGAKTERGMPIGNQTSQVFGMFYLNEVDRLVKEKLRIRVYSRYMDDFLLVHQDKEYVQYALQCITETVTKLGLKLNSKTQIFPLKNGVTYLGFRYFVKPDGKIVKTVKKRTKRRMRWRARLLKKAYLDGAIDGEQVRMSFASMHGHLKYGSCYKIQKELYDKLKFIPEIANCANAKRFKNAG